MSAVSLSLDVTLDGCDTATLSGIVRDALAASPRFREFAEFRGAESLTFTTEGDEPGYVGDGDAWTAWLPLDAPEPADESVGSRIELVHVRHSDAGCDTTVYVDGNEAHVNAYASVDPGNYAEAADLAESRDWTLSNHRDASATFLSHTESAYAEALERF